MPWNQESPADPLWQAVILRGERACPALGCVAAPIQQNAVCQELLREWLWGRYAAQRGASPLTTGSLLARTNPFVTKALPPVHAPGVHTERVGLSRWPCCACPTSIPQPTFCNERSSLVVSGLAPRWAAKQPQSSRMRCAQVLLSGWLWGRYAAQRGASPLTTGSLLARTNPFVTKTLLPGPRPTKNLAGPRTGHIGFSRWPCCARPTSSPQPTFCDERSSLVVSGLAPRWAAQQPQSSRMRCVRNYSVDGFGAATQPNAGQARSPQKLARQYESIRHKDTTTGPRSRRTHGTRWIIKVAVLCLPDFHSPADFLWRTIIPCGERACPALGCAAAPIQQNAVHQVLLSGWLWGRYAAQRGASPLTTGSSLASTNPFPTEKLLALPRLT
jgi:hypothetical protein